MRYFCVFFSSNNIDDIVQVEFLALCQHLTRLTFDGNPICLAANLSAADVSVPLHVVAKPS